MKSWFSNNRFFTPVTLLTVIISIGVSIFLFFPRSKQTIPTYFSYTKEELDSLKSLKSKKRLNIEEAIYWEEKAYNWVEQNKEGSTVASKLYAYLWVAQSEAANLSYLTHHQMMGSMGPISQQVLCLFYPDACSQISLGVDTDDYSEAVARLILNKMKKRKTADDQQTKPYEIKKGDQFWKSTGVYHGQKSGSWKTWIIQSSSLFRPPPPPNPDSEEMNKQLQLVKNAFASLTEEQKKMTIFWSGIPGTKTDSGIWLHFAEASIKKSKIPLPELLKIRAVLAMGIADANIAAADAKYTYWAKRPFMLDPSMQTYMPTPSHPSYPSNGAVIAGAAETILTHFFPEQKSHWALLAQEACQSRVWSGIHFPVDTQIGYQMGKSIGNTVLQSPQTQTFISSVSGNRHAP